MGRKRPVLQICVAAWLILIASAAMSAYHHMGEIDSDIFLSVYPEKAGTKLDSCNLCHSGGQYVDSKGRTVSLGSCQWCHYIYGYDKQGDIQATLNPYGAAYKEKGRDADAVREIDSLDSDADGFDNKKEILATRFPGDAKDDPTKVAAPSRVFTLEQIEKMPQLKQFMLMNTHKSDDFYAEYTGVNMDVLLNRAGKLPSATGITVFAPDGWAQFHPLEADPDPVLYHVNGKYPRASYYYDDQADVSKNEEGWTDYSAPSCTGRAHGDIIVNEKSMRMLLAFKRDEQYLTPGVLTPDNKLDGEGPFRVVPPQKNPGPPDQKSTALDQDVVWPFNEDADHNAGFSTRSTTIIRIEPLPEGTTDIDTLEAGWDFVDEGKVVVYGAINPRQNIKTKLKELGASIEAMKDEDFVHPFLRSELSRDVRNLRLIVGWGYDEVALNMLQTDIMPKFDGCGTAGSPDENDWTANCEIQNQLYWAMNEIAVLLGLLQS